MPQAPLKILLIEDSPTDALLLRELLRQVTEFAFEMDHVLDLDSAVKTMSVNNFDAIVSDLGLPDSAGIKTYESIRKSAPHTPVIIVSGNHDRDLLTDVLNRGADNYLIKDNFDGNRVAIAILSAIRNRSAA
jgi:two-component system sensor histidine kinase UhpB